MGHIVCEEMPPRILRSTPTAELGLLLQATQRSLLHENNLGLCYNAGINFVGSLLVLKNQADYIKMVKESGKEPSNELMNPVWIIDSLTLDDSGMTTSNILFKNACGPLKSGLVIAGPLSGLITGEMGKTESRKDIVTPVRIFNDEPIPEDPLRYHPYYPYFFEGQPYPDLKPEDAETDVGIFTKTLQDKFKKDYLEYVKSVRATSEEHKQLFVSDLLMRLCSDLKIPLSQDEFQYTRDPVISSPIVTEAPQSK